MKRRIMAKGWSIPWIVFATFLLFFIVFYIKFCYIALSDVVEGTNMEKFTENRNKSYKTLYASRGSIYDKDGNILAVDVSAYTVIAYLDERRTGSSTEVRHVVDKEKTAELLSPLINMSKEDILLLLNKTKEDGTTYYQVELRPGGKGISETTKQAIEGLNLPGIDFIEYYKRYYPNGNFASYILGYAKTNEEIVTEDGVSRSEYSITGEWGFEKKYEDILKGTDGHLLYQQDRDGYKIPDTVEIEESAINGTDIYLTLDSNIQRFAENAIQTIEKTYNPTWSTITVMDAKTGEILASSASPTFNPNNSGAGITYWYNPLVSTLYEPGSVMKIYTYMCALETGNYVGTTGFLSGKKTIGDADVVDWNNVGWGWINYDLGFEYSSNVGVANLIEDYLDRNTLKECLMKYGFGSITSEEFSQEKEGTLNFTYPIEVANAGFGQGITTTAIQQLQALTIIANNGKMVIPKIISKMVDTNTNETTYSFKKETSEQIVSTQTVKYIKNLMHNVIYGNNIGTTGTAYRINGIDIIGKTGTAQISDTVNGGYLKGYADYVYSFAVMFPEEDPQIIIYAAMQQPKWGGSYGLSTAVKEVIINTAKYLDIYQNTTEATVSDVKLDSYINKKVTDVTTILEKNNIKGIFLGNGDTIISQYPIKDVTIVSKDKVFLLTNGNEIKMPNVKGYSKIEIIALCKLLGINYEIEGTGYVVSQSISADTIITKDSILTVTLSSYYGDE